ncbi:lipid-A-disaccharide synthase [Pelagibius sp. CAU 1746]|uniref:lipid-A-disaccharide synthase n=1 Tax=Pelagibius sp. CAU 1746 TaxID=3140370 RepID=UPI00325B76E1
MSRPENSDGGEGEGPLIFLIAGEPSGDLLGARLMAALREETDGRVRFAGIGGEAMTAAGLESRFPIHELAVMGLIEVLPHLFTILKRMRQTVAAVKQLRPDAVVTIDSPSFTLEIAERLKGQGIPLIHYVAPQVWAWKAWRAKSVSRYLDHLLALLPFEPPYFEKHGLPTHFVGHPVVESHAGSRYRDTARGLCLAVLPGSRRGEVSKLLPVFAEVVRALAAGHPDLRVVIPTVETVADMVQAQVQDWPVEVAVVRGAEAKAKAFDEATAALAASGTVALELGVAGVPTVVAYRFAGVVGLLPPSLLRVPFVSLVNLIAGREVQPEFLQRRCRAAEILPAVERLLTDPAARAAQRDGCSGVVEALTPPEGRPSRAAARRILSCLKA